MSIPPVQRKPAFAWLLPGVGALTIAGIFVITSLCKKV